MNPVYGYQFEYSLIGTKGALWVRMFSKQISVFEKIKSLSRPDIPEIVLKRVEDYSKLPLNLLGHNPLRARLEMCCKILFWKTG